MESLGPTKSSQMMEVTITFNHAGPDCDLSGKVRILPGKVPIVDRLQKGRQQVRNVTIDQGTGNTVVELTDDLLRELAEATNIEDGMPLWWEDDEDTT